MRKKRWAAGTGVLVVAATAVVVQTWPSPDGSTGDSGASRAQASNDTAPPRISTDERSELQRALDEVVEEGSSGAVAELVESNEAGRDRWNGVAGVSDRETNAPVDPGAHFRVASLSKTFVAAVALQLVEEGEFALDDTVGELLPGVLDENEDATLRMLLSHTSGIFSYNSEMPEVLDSPHRSFAPEELVEIANEEGPDFAPGSEVAYSNTNFVLVAMAIERATGNRYTDEVADRVITPLGLDETSVPMSEEIPRPVMRAYVADEPERGGSPAPRDITEFDPTRWYGTAQVVSTVTDVNRFWEALLNGEVLGDATLEEMLTVVDTASSGEGYALGVRRHTLSCDLDVWLHTGNIPGYRTWSVHAGRDRHLTMFQARYVDDPDPPAWDLVETGLCPSEAPEEPAPTPTDRPGEPVEGAGRGHDG
ncbi:serine hydrolase domain-containing protein [Halostreptopolyspora alba]|uniref:Class A beta-lactamase-related serine hydrolase n=1 Tax=Halostreptopolyspora alba TaxID=2487137 RepID=A0A3N0E9Y7_9ACTN|nr:class A beta-lactamase-related serine hydrolase [Nocardiopsaceae bacterium YIM 96095]